MLASLLRGVARAAPENGDDTGRCVGSTLHRRVLRQVTKEGKVEADPGSLSHGSFHRAFLSAGGDLERAAT